MNETSNRKKLLVGTGIYAVGTFGTKILMFLIAPLYTYYLSTSEFGTYDVLISTIGLLIPIISLQIADAVYRFVIREDAADLSYVCITYQFLVVSSIITTVVIVFLNRFIDIPYFLYFLGALFSALFFQISQRILRGLKRQWLFAVSGIVYTVVFLLLNIIQLCILHKGVESLFLSYIIANLFGITTVFLFEKRLLFNLFTKPDLEKLKSLLRLSIPLIPNYLSWWIIDSSDKYIVLWFLGASANGVLGITHKFPAILQSVFGLFLNSWQDLAIASDKSESEFFTSVFQKLYSFSFMLLWVLIPITKVFVMLVMESSYKIASNYIPFYYLGAVFSAFCSFYGVGYLRSKNTGGAFTSSFYAALINAIVNIGLIKTVGLHAAAVSTFVALFVMWLIRVKHNKKELEIIIERKRFISLLTIDISLCIISIIGGFTINCVLAVLGVLGFIYFSKAEIIAIVNLVKKHKG